MLEKDVKKWLKKDDARYIIVEQGKPQYVVMSLKEYEKIIAKKTNPGLEDINEQIAVISEKETDTP